MKNQPHLVRFLLRWRLRSRRTSHVPVTPETVYFVAEDTRTFHIQKFVGDDTGIMRIDPEGIDLELSRQIIHLAPEDVQAEIRQVRGTVGVMLTARFGEWPWSIALVPIPNSTSKDGMHNARRNAEELLYRIRRLTSPQPPPMAPRIRPMM